jgi:hypothetical protein
MTAGVRRWPLFLIAAPAAVSIWSGWVGLGQLCGFGLVRPLPGIAGGFQVDTAITLPVGVEAYGAYALGAWLSLAAGHQARAFARRSAVGSLVLGMLDQVAYHLLSAAHATRAPWPVVVLVACLPVATLGFGAALTHLLRSAPVHASRPAATDEMPVELAASLAVPGAVPASGREAEPVPGAHPAASGPAAARAADASAGRLLSWLTGGDTAAPEPPPALNGHGHAARELFATGLAAGEVPSIRAIRSGLSVGQDRAQQVQAYLREITRT